MTAEVDPVSIESDPVPAPLEVLLITGFGCKPCDRVKERLHRLQVDFPKLHIRAVDVGSEEGRALALRYRLVGLPGILINGRMALVGDVSEALLRQRLSLTLGPRQGIH